MGTLLLIRHGQASAFEENYDRLSSKGELQARLLGETLRSCGRGLERIFCGPRVRQVRTAEIAAEAGGLPAPVVVDDLDEMRVEPLYREQLPLLFEKHAHLRSLGDAMLAADGDAARAKTFARLFAGVLSLWQREQLHAPGVESWREFQARVRRALKVICVGRAAAFTSAGPISAALQLATGATDEVTLGACMRVRNAALSEFLFSGERFSLVSFNETPWLRDEALLTLR